MAKTMVDFDWAFMQRLDLNKEQTAELLDVSPSSIKGWKRKGVIPLGYLHIAQAITPAMAAGVQTWVTFDLRDLRNALGLTQDEMAGELRSSVSRIGAWEQRGEIPRDRHARALQLAHQTMNRVVT